MYQVNDKVIAVFNKPLPDKDVAPKLELKKEYTIVGIYVDHKGNQHLDVGLVNDVTYIESFETGQKMPQGIRWCHPNRFILASSKL